MFPNSFVGFCYSCMCALPCGFVIFNFYSKHEIPKKKKINFYAFYTCISYRFFIMEVLVNISLWLSFVTLDWTSCLGLCLVCWRGWGVHSFYFTHERLISVSNNNSHNKVIVIVIVLSLKEVKELLLRMYNEIYSYLC